MHRLGVGILPDLERLHAVEERAGRIGAVRILIAQRSGGSGSIPFLAAGHAGMTTDANIEIDDESELGHLRLPALLTFSFPLAGGRLGWGLKFR